MLNTAPKKITKNNAQNEYYITDSKRKQIKTACESSRKRREDIINRFFYKTHSDSSVIASWLQDVSLHFFKCFSDEWISDLLAPAYYALSRYVMIWAVPKRRRGR